MKLLHAADLHIDSPLRGTMTAKLKLNLLEPGIRRDLLQQLSIGFRLRARSPHGPSHWMRVRRNGLTLSPLTGANPRVVELFALFHDSCRHGESNDPDHGPRAGALARELFRRGQLLIDREELDLLVAACEGHTHRRTHGDPTIATCWDADRLDLPRVGIRVAPHRLCTSQARHPDIIFAAQQRALDWIRKISPIRYPVYCEEMGVEPVADFIS